MEDHIQELVNRYQYSDEVKETAALGLSLLVAKSAFAFTLIKYLGAAYLDETL